MFWKQQTDFDAFILKSQKKFIINVNITDEYIGEPQFMRLLQKNEASKTDQINSKANTLGFYGF